MNNKALRERKKTSSDNSTFTGKPGELIIITDEKTISIHDGLSSGGTKLSKEDTNFTSIHQHNTATQSTPGFLSAADKTKLDNLSQQALPPASSQNNPDTLVRRDSNGDFAARNITAVQFIGALNGLATGISGNLTGDVTSIGMVTTLQNVVSPGNYGSSSEVPRITVDAKGRITAVQLQPISATASGSAGGDLGGTYPNPTVETVGTRTKSQISQSVLDTINATNSPTANTLVKRDNSSKFRSGLTSISDSSDTVVSKSYVDALGGSGGYSNFAVYRRNPSSTVQEVSVNGAAFTTSNASNFAVPSNVRVIGMVLVSGGRGGPIINSPSAFNSNDYGGTSGALFYASMVPVVPASNLSITVGQGGSGASWNLSTTTFINETDGGSTIISGLLSFLTGAASKTITIPGGTGSNFNSLTSGSSPVFFIIPSLGGDYAYIPNVRKTANGFGWGGAIAGTPTSESTVAFGSFSPLANILELGNPVTPISFVNSVARSGIGSGGTAAKFETALSSGNAGGGGHGYVIIFY